MAETRLPSGVTDNSLIEVFVRLSEGGPVFKIWLKSELSGHP
jgi:hypothetical protein